MSNTIGRNIINVVFISIIPFINRDFIESFITKVELWPKPWLRSTAAKIERNKNYRL